MSYANQFILEALATTFENLSDDPVVLADVEDIPELLSEMEESHDKVEESGRAIDELETAVEKLNLLATTLESIRAEGGLDSKGAKILAVASRMATDNLHLSIAESIRPAMESVDFGSTGDRVKATMEAEGKFKETAKRIGGSIWNAIVSFFKGVYNFFMTIGNGTKALIVGGKTLGEKVKAANGKTAKDEDIDVSSFASTLAVGDKVDPSAAINLMMNAGRDLGGVSQSAVSIFVKGVEAGETSEQIKYKLTTSSAGLKKLLSTKLAGEFQFKSEVKEGITVVSIEKGPAKTGEFKVKPMSLGDLNSLAELIAASAAEVAKRGEVYAGEIKRLESQIKPDAEAKQNESYASLLSVVRVIVGAMSKLVSVTGIVIKAATACGKKHLSAYGAVKSDTKKDGDGNDGKTSEGGDKK